MKTTGFLLLMLLAFNGIAQNKTVPKKFTLPKNATINDYQSGVLLAKLKPAYRDMASASPSGGRVASAPDIIIRPMSNPAIVKQNLSARGPFAKSNIDISLYVKIHFSSGTNVEQKINELYATGYFDIIEPNYAARTTDTPNDPSISSQYYLTNIHAFEGWDISKSDDQTVIAIVDSGGDLDHPDLASKIYTNPDDNTVDGVDNDHDGYIDNIHGWDFMGADTLNAYSSTFTGDNDPNLNLTGTGGELIHGVWVAGCAGAATNNLVGMAGVGYNARILITKHTADNQDPTKGTIYFGYDGILYAAQTLTQDNVPRKIINCSWAGTFRSQIAQDLMTHVTLDLGCLVVGAAGNDNNTVLNYPAAYDYVLSVAATSSTDAKSTFSTYGTTIDVCAPGTSIYTTQYNNLYGTVSGTSFSSPITAGAAALVWSHNPTFTPMQVGEQLRTTADNIDATNVNYVNQLGKGRINLKSALTLTLPSIRASNSTLLNSQGVPALLGQQTSLTLDFTNYLQDVPSLSVTATSSSTYLTFSTNQIALGTIAQGATLRNTSAPLIFTANTATPENTSVQIMLTFTSGTYKDFQFITISLNPSFLTIDENTISTTITSSGRLGYDDPSNQANGVGFVFNDHNVLFEMGVMMGTSATNLFSNTRGTGTTFDQDFVKVTAIKKLTPGLRSTSEIVGSYSPTALSSLLISYTSIVMRDAPNEKFIILEYVLKNSATTAINNFRFGIFADWDISDSGAKDAAGWDDAHKLGYIFPKQSTSLPHAGIQVLNASSNYFAIDNDQAIIGNPFGLYDGFTKTEKFTSLSTQRLTAGETTAAGNDVSHVVTAGPFSIPAGGQTTIAFALHVANNLNELLASADAANTLYNTIFNLPRPVVATTNVCYGTAATLNATGATGYNWYKDSFGGTPLQSGSQFITGNLLRDTTLYVSSTDNSQYESVRTPAIISIRANPTITASATQFCTGQPITLSVGPADDYLWSTGETTQTISVGTAGDYSVRSRFNGTACENNSAPITVTSLPSPSIAFTSDGNPYTLKSIQFTDQSTDVAKWAWTFGDGGTSAIKNPTHTYFTAQNYAVGLTVTSVNGCSATLSKSFDIITGLEDQDSEQVIAYPNPASQRLTFQLPFKSQPVALSMFSMTGQSVMNTTVDLDSKGQAELLVGQFSEGLYLIRVNANNQTIHFKVEIKQ